MHFIEESVSGMVTTPNVLLHTSKRMHFIEEADKTLCKRCLTALHTSKRMHFIEDSNRLPQSNGLYLAYVKTYALH